MKTRYFIRCSYDGTSFSGWQEQKNTKNTIQTIVNQILKSALGEKIVTTGCGRTDAGVHAREFYFNLDSEDPNLAEDKQKWLYKFNRMLPGEIVFHDILEVGPDVSSRWDAIRRTYRYYITRKKDPFLINRAWYFYGDIDLKKMREASEILLEQKDFAAFCKARGQQKTTLCKVDNATWIEENDMLIFTISADRFLRNMVRAITGTLIDVGKGKIGIDQFRDIIIKKKRTGAGLSVPAWGLYLEKVEYAEDIFVK